MWRRPVLIVTNTRTGKDVMPALSGLWKEVSVTLNEGEESDELEIVCIGPPLRAGLPAKGDVYNVRMGWADEGPVDQGSYKVTKVTARGSPSSGETVTITARAADLDDKAKAAGRSHHDEETAEARLKKAAEKMGLDGLSIDPGLGAKTLPYALRWEQSWIDFAVEQADQIGGVAKIASNKLVVTAKNGGKSAGGKELEPIRIRWRAGMDYDLEVDGRGTYGHCSASWIDEKSGKRALVKEATGRDGPIFVIAHPLKTESAAKEAVKAWIAKAKAVTGSGTFEQPGLPRARAGAKVEVSGFGPGIDGSWRAKSLRKTVSAGSSGGFKTTVTVDAGDEEKGAKKKAKKDA